MAWDANVRSDADLGPGRIRQIRLAPIGWHTRYMLRSYIRYTIVVTLGLLVVALTIDLTPRFATLLSSRPDAQGLEAAGLIAWYIVLRSADILARNMPLAIYLAVLWCEFVHTLASERIIVAVSGRSPLQCLTPALIFGAAFGLLQLTLDLWLRPAAVMTQASEHLGNYGDRFDRRPTGKLRWVRAGDDLISAQVEYGPPPVLRDVTLYRLQPDGEPHEVVIARMAIQGSIPSQWDFRDGYYWDWNPQQPLQGEAKERQARGEPSPTQAFARREIQVDLDPLWLTNLDINGKYLPERTLEKLASSPNLGFSKSDYQTWVQVRYARGLFVLGMVLLGASLGQISLMRMPPLYGLLAILLLGYFGHVAVKTLEIMGELDTAPPIIAGWLVPILLILIAGVVQFRTYRRVG